MSKFNRIQFFYLKQLVLLIVIFFVCVVNVGALNISDVPLELSPSLPPNVLILMDDSGSMDWEVLTQHVENDGALCSPTFSGVCDFAGIIHRVPEGGAPVSCEPYVNPPPIVPPLVSTEDFTRGYLYGVRFPGDPVPTDSALANDNVIENCYVAADDDFRFRSAAFNPLYFDPNKTYIPWAGVDINGNAYTDADINKAPDDPYDPQVAIDLTTEMAGLDISGNRITGTGFKYYDWNDANSNGIFEAGEETEHLIRDFLTTGATPDADRVRNFANWFTYYRKREYVAKAIASHAVTDRNSAYFDYATINQNTSNEIRVDRTDTTYFDDLDANQSALIDAITQSITSTNRTPLRTSLDKVGKYFQCAADDIFNSVGSTSAGNSNCPILAAPSGECQFNSTFVFTDGFNNEIGVVGDEDDGPNSNFDGFAFKDGRPNTLADVAMLYYETDLSSLTDNVPVTSVDFSRDPNPGTLAPGDLLHQHMKTNTVGIFSNLSIPPVNTSFPADVSIENTSFWSDPDASFEGKMQDLVHASYNGRGNFVSVFDSSDFSAAINEVESSFSRAASNFGSTTAVAFNSSSITQDTLVFRTFSNLATNAGELVAQRVNPNGTFDTFSNGDPRFEWSAATKLDARTSPRNILTYEPIAQQGRTFEITAPTTTGLSVSPQQDNLEIPRPTTPVSATLVEDRVEYLRGERSNEGTDFMAGEMRIREDTTTNGIRTGAVLGDIVHSNPVFVGEPPFANRFGGLFPSTPTNTYFEFRVANQTREQLVYVGANDGMLHAFQVSDGIEKFAYVPNEILDKLGEYTSPNYSHLFYVDSTPSVNDAYIEQRGGGSPDWRTVLVNGLGAGGQGYFALDITDPNNIDENSVMWEFTDEDDIDLGFSFSVPIIAMSNAPSTGDKKWVAIFGNGYNNSEDDGAFKSTTGNAAIYIVYLEEGYNGWVAGSDFIKLDTGIGDPTSPNGIGGVTGIDTDGNGTVDRLYAGDLLGNVYIVDMSSTNDSSWDITSNLLFTASYDEFGVAANAIPQPITTKPTVIDNPEGGYIVIVGTGSYFTTDDALNTDIQSIYGLWDDTRVGGDTSTISKYSPSDLVEQEFTTQIDNNGFVTRTVSLNTVDYTVSPPPRGWFIDFDIPPPGSSSGVQFPGERPVRNLQLRNNQLFFSTVIPQDGMSCSATSGGFGLSVDPLTGSVGTDVIFDINIDGLFDENDNLNGLTGQANIVVGTQFESSPGDSTFIGDYRVTQLSNTNVDRILVNPDLNSGGSSGALLGRHSWKEIR
jgi:type IV pilus assembly protein PilY1